jgi:hypothetical protein
VTTLAKSERYKLQHRVVNIGGGFSWEDTVLRMVMPTTLEGLRQLRDDLTAKRFGTYRIVRIRMREDVVE